LNMEIIRNAILQGKWFMSHHARVRAGQRRTSDVDVIVALLQGQIIEDYPEDSRGHSCVVLGYTPDKRAIHFVEDVPAWVCESCKERYFDAETYLPHPDLTD